MFTFPDFSKSHCLHLVNITCFKKQTTIHTCFNFFIRRLTDVEYQLQKTLIVRISEGVIAGETVKGSVYLC